MAIRWSAEGEPQRPSQSNGRSAPAVTMVASGDAATDGAPLASAGEIAVASLTPVV